MWYEAKRYVFEECQFDQVFFVEDDLRLSPHTLTLLLSLRRWLDVNYTNACVIGTTTQCSMTLEEKQANLALVSDCGAMLNNHLLTRECWNLLRPWMHEYVTQFLQCAYRERDGDRIKEWMRTLAQRLPVQGGPRMFPVHWPCKDYFADQPVTSQDGAMALAIRLAGFSHVTTAVNRGWHIGKQGENASEEWWDRVYRYNQPRCFRGRQHPDVLPRTRMRDILIIVSTFNRRDLTGVTLDSLQRCKSQASDVLVLDDNSDTYDVNWLARWGWPVERREANVGVGRAAHCRYTRFLNAPEQSQYLCAVDNDLVFGARFDHRLRQLWEIARAPDVLSVLTGYRSVTQRVLAAHDGWVEVDGVGGAVQFVDRATARALIDTMPDNWWGHNWDHCISRVFQRKLATPRSLAQHLGVHGDGANGISADVAFDFVGENLW